jgi:hypothetical protein
MNRQLHRQLFSFGSRTIRLVALGACLVMAAGAPGDGRAAPIAAGSGQASATAYQGTLRARLSAATSGSGTARFTVQAWVKGRALIGGSVSMTTTDLSRPEVGSRSQPMHPRGKSYQASASLTPAQSWEVLLRIRDAAAFSGARQIAFCVRLAGDSPTLPDSAYPLFLPGLNGGAAASLPLGPFVAMIQATPAAAGQNGFQVRLSAGRKGQAFPASLRLDLTMLDMDMGHTYVTATRVRRGVYAGEGSLLMGGAWRVGVSTGAATGAAVLVAALHPPA